MALLLYDLCGFLMENCFSSKQFASGFGLDFRLFQLENEFRSSCLDWLL